MTALNPERMIGSKIGQFRLDEYISRGAMGMVFKAFDTVLERTVALKLIPKTADQLFSDGEEARKRFVQEAKATARLSDHPNIVTIHTSGETEDFQYICMEYVSGKSLSRILQEEKLLTPEKALPIFEQVLLAIHAAHQAEITHRDIKPSNIMITDEGEVRVVDFGIAKLASLAITTTGAVLGTPYYMSPEQITGSRVDSRSDIFSIGAVLYQVLTGERPFEGESTTALIYKIVNTEPVPPNIINAHVPEPLCGLIRRAMAKSPGDRYQTPSEMLQALRDVTAYLKRGNRPGRDEAAHPPKPVESPPANGNDEIGGKTEILTRAEPAPSKPEAAGGSAQFAVQPPVVEEEPSDVWEESARVAMSPQREKSSRAVWFFTLAFACLLAVGAGLFFLWPVGPSKFVKKPDVSASAIKPQPLPPVQRNGSLIVRANPPGASVRIVGGEPYRDGMELPPGDHQVEVSGAGYAAKTVTARVASGQSTQVEVSLEKEPQQQAVPPVTEAGGALAEAWSLFKASKYEEAVPAFQAALKQAESAEAYKGLGQSLYKLRRYEAALDPFQKYKAMAPGSGEPSHWLGWTYLRLQQPREALANLGESNRIQSRAANFLGISWAYVLLWEFDSAMAPVRKAIDLEPKNGDHYNALGWIHYYQKRYAAASAQFDRAIALGRKDDNLVGSMLSYYHLGRYSEAASNIDSYIAKGDVKGGSLFDLRVILAYCHLANGNYEVAKQQFSALSTGSSVGIWVQIKAKETGLRTHTVFKYSPAFFASLAPGDMISAANGVDLRNKVSSDYWKLVNSQKSGSPVKLSIFRNGALMEKTVVAGITPELIAAIEKRKQDVKLRYDRGNNLLGAKNYRGAVLSYKSALELEDAFAPLYHGLAMAQLALGQKKEAAANLEHYLDRRPDAADAADLRRIIRENSAL